MNAHKFVAEKGVDEAKRVLSGAPEWTFGYDYIDNEYFNGADIQDGYSIEHCNGCFLVEELKQVVESVELVDSYNGPEMAKRFIEENMDCSDSVRLEKAIADYKLVESYKEVGNG